MAYKDINDVMKSQKALINVVATFTPKIVRMANDMGGVAGRLRSGIIKLILQ